MALILVASAVVTSGVTRVGSPRQAAAPAGVAVEPGAVEFVSKTPLTAHHDAQRRRLLQL